MSQTEQNCQASSPGGAGFRGKEQSFFWPHQYEEDSGKRWKNTQTRVFNEIELVMSRNMCAD